MYPDCAVRVCWRKSCYRVAINTYIVIRINYNYIVINVKVGIVVVFVFTCNVNDFVVKCCTRHAKPVYIPIWEFIFIIFPIRRILEDTICNICRIVYAHHICGNTTIP